MVGIMVEAVKTDMVGIMVEAVRTDMAGIVVEAEDRDMTSIVVEAVKFEAQTPTTDTCVWGTTTKCPYLNYRQEQV